MIKEKLNELKEHVKEHPVKTAVTVIIVPAIIGTSIYLNNGRSRAEKRDCYAIFDKKGLKVTDVDVTDFVLKHLNPIDRLDPYAVTNAVFWTQGIMEGFGGDTPVPEGNWKFFKDSK